MMFFHPAIIVEGNNKKYKPRFFCQFCGRPLTNEAWDILEKRLEEIRWMQ